MIINSQILDGSVVGSGRHEADTRKAPLPLTLPNDEVKHAFPVFVHSLRASEQAGNNTVRAQQKKASQRGKNKIKKYRNKSKNKI